MNAFKGTKGKWHYTSSQTVYSISYNNPRTIADCENRTLKGNEEQYNALLISKAPEMLEMLNDIKGYLGSDKRAEVEQLIKEATEL